MIITLETGHIFDTGEEVITRRLVHCLMNEGCRNLADALAKESDPKWSRGLGRAMWLRVPNIGKKSYAELCALLDRHKRPRRHR
jgi:hypothetical protein